MLGRLGTIDILEVIGRGGMGIVLKGRQPELGRYVVVKVLAPHLAASGAARQRFAREARAAAAVVHPHVMAIHAVDVARRLPYLVMPYIACESLQQRLDCQGPLTLQEVLRIGHQVACGLAAAHAQGLVHRDVKPANILLEKGVDRVLLTDFGLARAVDDASLTRTGVIAGTPQYMSPEQVCGHAIDVRSDLFSLGSALYAACTGRPPFRAETSYGILRRITDNEPRPIAEINPDIPDWLVAIIGKLQAKSPDDRFTSAAVVADLLAHCLAHVQQPATVPLPRECMELARRSAVQFSPPRTNRGRWFGSRLVAVASAAVVVVGLLLTAVLGPALRTWLRPLSGANTGRLEPGRLPTAGEVPGGRDETLSLDPAIAWDAMATEIEALDQDAAAVEAGVQRWTGPSDWAAAEDPTELPPL